MPLSATSPVRLFESQRRYPSGNTSAMDTERYRASRKSRRLSEMKLSTDSVINIAV
jgi:hypothetical protein